MTNTKMIFFNPLYLWAPWNQNQNSNLLGINIFANKYMYEKTNKQHIEKKVPRTYKPYSILTSPG